MEYRTLKQLIFGGIYFAIFLFLIISLYFAVIKPAPTCFDGTQNQNETGVDCGGVCAQICLPPDLQPVSLVDVVDVFTPTSNKVALLARLKNPNTLYGALVSYHFEVITQQGEVLAKVPQQTILYPGQVRYLIVPSLDLPDSSSQRLQARLIVDTTDWHPAEVFHQPQVIVRDYTAVRDGAFVRVQGNITNSDIVDVSQATVIAVFSNEFRLSVGAAQTQIFEVRSGETKNFTIVYPLLPGFSLEATQVFVTAD